jgi:hypothetical protein
MFLPVIPVFSAENTHSDLQLAKIAMSPVEHTRKHRQRTGPRKKGAGKFLTGNVFAVLKAGGLEVFAVRQDSNVTCGTFAEASSADWSAKEGCGNVLTGAPGVAKVD